MREEGALLAQARVVTAGHEALAAANGHSFNLFSILGMETDEVHTHSASLAELPNPQGSHRQGSVFVRLFAERFSIPTDGIESARIWSEGVIDKASRIDLILLIGDTCVVVENKIRAPDQCRQLERYHAYASQWPNHRVLYLTLHGDAPGDYTLGDLSADEVVCVSYENDVLGWLDDCIKEVARVPQLREILAHYQTLLRKLTGKATGELVMDLKDLLRQQQGDAYNFELAPGIARAMTALSVEKEWKFWRTLRDRLAETDARPWRMKRLDVKEAASVPLKEVDEGIIGHAHGIGNKNKWRYGWTFRIESDGDPERYRIGGHDVLLRIECDGGGWGFYGFIAVGNPATGRRLSRSEHGPLFEEWGGRLSKVEDGWRTGGDLWVAWAWPDEDVPLQKAAGWLEPAALRRLLEGKAVDALVTDVHATIDALEGAAAAPTGSDELR